MNIGDRIKAERERLGFKQDDFAEKGGVSRRSQVMYEQNKTDASAGYFTKIAELGADVNYILTGVRMVNTPVEIERSEQNEVVPIRAKQFAEIFQFLNAKQQEEIFAVIEEKKRINVLENVVGNMQRQLERMTMAA